MKYKPNKSLWIGLLCVILGIVISLQFKIVQKNYLEGLNPGVVSSQLISELTKLRGEKAELAMQVDELQKKIDDIEDSAASESQVIKGLKDELDKYKIVSGAVDVQGDGVEVIIDNPAKELSFSNDLNIINEYEYILRAINELFAGGAEAISVNEQRIISTSEVRTAGKSLVINKVPVSAPIVIKAIGNSREIDGALVQRFGIVGEIREAGYSIEVREAKNVSVVKYNGEMGFKYARVKKSR